MKNAIRFLYVISTIFFELLSYSTLAQINDIFIVHDSLQLIDASYESLEMTRVKHNMRLPYKRTDAILILDKGEKITTELFEKNFNAGLYDKSTIKILKDKLLVNEFTTSDSIKIVIKIE